MKLQLQNLANTSSSVRFEVFTAVTMKNAVFWDINPQFILHRRHYFITLFYYVLIQMNFSYTNSL
jgi:hypothetical protein